MIIAATALGVIATLLEVGSYLRRERGGILAWQVASASFWAAHFYLLGAETGMAMNLIGAFRQAVFFYRGRRSWAGWSGWPWLISGLFIGGTVLFWDGLHSLMPLTAMIISTAAFWQMQTRSLRLIAMIPPPLWFAYNAISGSWPGMVTEVAIIASQITGFLRWEKSPKWGTSVCGLKTPA